MSVATAISDLSARIQGAFQACEEKGATMPQSRTTHTLSATIESIQGGLPSTVVVSGDVEAYSNNSRWGTTFSNQPASLTDAGKYATHADLREVGSVGAYGLAYAFRNNTNLSSVETPIRMDITNNYASRNAFMGTGIQGSVTVELSSNNAGPGLYAVEGMLQQTGIEELVLDFKVQSLTVPANAANFMNSMVKNCTSLRKFTMRGLKTLTMQGTVVGQNFFGSDANNAFRGIGTAGLNDYTIEDLETVVGGSTASSPSLGLLSWYDNGAANAVVRFPHLKEIRAHENASCTTSFLICGSNSWARVKEVYMPSCTYVGKWSFNYVRSATIHFAAANQAAIQACAGYSSNFQRVGGDGTLSIVFDL